MMKERRVKRTEKEEERREREEKNRLGIEDLECNRICRMHRKCKKHRKANESLYRYRERLGCPK